MSLELTKKIVKVLDDKLARDIEVIKTEEVTIVADYFVIATANSNTHVRALADEIEYQLEQEDIRPDHVEGIFLEDSRQYYNLERLWDDASKIDISQFID